MTGRFESGAKRACLVLLALAAGAAAPTPTVHARHRPVRRAVHAAPLVTSPPLKKGPAKKAPAKKAPAKPAAPAKPPPPKLPPDVGTSTGLHLPRFASLRSDDVNMRSGPGERYPVLWVYKRRELPVEITREFDVWRLVTDMDGIKGWVHQATLTGSRSFVVVGKSEATLRAQPDDGAAAVAELRPGVVGKLRRCDAGSAWCEVEAGGYRGWLPREAFWGTLSQEAVQP